ncbi:MAG: histidine phosphatase family protein [Magnetococcales bacterium]|nr:histidine phosphatase family protein [Magnetococcales bacterium]
MPRQLLIMRHAKSAWDTGVPDFDRPLADRGLRDAPRVGAWLQKSKLIPDHVVSSPAERARQTVIAVCNELDFKKKKIIWDPRVYGAGSEDLLEVLSEVPKKAKVVLLVGHNPGLEFLTNHLTGTAESTYDDMSDVGLIKTATVVHLKMPDDWSNLSAGCASLVVVKNPGDLNS